MAFEGFKASKQQPCHHHGHQAINGKSIFYGAEEPKMQNEKAKQFPDIRIKFAY